MFGVVSGYAVLKAKLRFADVQVWKLAFSYVIGRAYAGRKCVG